MGIVCKWCLIYGNPTRPGGSTAIKDVLETDEDLVEHIEMVHCMPVKRPGETSEQAEARVRAKNPRMGTAECTCPRCDARRRLMFRWRPA